MVFFMADCSEKLKDTSSHSASTGHHPRWTPEIVRLSAPPSRANEQTGQEYLPVTGNGLPTEIDDAILKFARVLARQAAREDHAHQQAGSACHDETSGDLRAVLHRSAK